MAGGPATVPRGSGVQVDVTAHDQVVLLDRDGIHGHILHLLGGQGGEEHPFALLVGEGPLPLPPGGVRGGEVHVPLLVLDAVDDGGLVLALVDSEHGDPLAARTVDGCHDPLGVKAVAAQGRVETDPPLVRSQLDEALLVGLRFPARREPSVRQLDHGHLVEPRGESDSPVRAVGKGRRHHHGDVLLPVGDGAGPVGRPFEELHPHRAVGPHRANAHRHEVEGRGGVRAVGEGLVVLVEHPETGGRDPLVGVRQHALDERGRDARPPVRGERDPDMVAPPLVGALRACDDGRAGRDPQVYAAAPPSRVQAVQRRRDRIVGEVPRDPALLREPLRDLAHHRDAVHR